MVYKCYLHCLLIRWSLVGLQKTKVQRRKKKLQAYDLSSLSEFLPELEAHQKPKAELKLNRKTKQKLV